MTPLARPRKTPLTPFRDSGIVSREDAKARKNPACFAVFAASREPCHLSAEITSFFHLRRTSKVSRARMSAHLAAVGSAEGGSNGHAPSKIAGPIRALAVVTVRPSGNAYACHRDEMRDLTVENRGQLCLVRFRQGLTRRRGAIQSAPRSPRLRVGHALVEVDEATATGSAR